jgi:prepilin-type processing-associated H-X9-DG protein
VDPITNQYPQPYKLSHIKRSSEIALIFDATLVNDVAGGEGLNVPDTVPVGCCLDGDVLFNSNKPTTALTDDYSYSKNTNGAISPGNPLRVTAAYQTPPFSNPLNINTDTAFGAGVGAPGGAFGNLRYRHIGNTKCNVLFADGHVEPFTYNPKTQENDLLEKNVNVNP